MDVRLPDGTILRGVPEGTTKDDLRAKLEANGYKGFGLADPADQARRENTVSRALGENVRGGLAAIGDMIMSAPGDATDAYVRGVTTLGGGDPKLVKQVGEDAGRRITQAITPNSMEEAFAPDRESGAYKNIMLPFEKMIQGYGDIGRTAEMLGGAGPDAKTGAAIGENAFVIGMGSMAGLEVGKRTQQRILNKSVRDAEAQREALRVERERVLAEKDQMESQRNPTEAQNQLNFEQKAAQPDFFDPQPNPNSRGLPGDDTTFTNPQRTYEETRPYSGQMELFGEQPRQFPAGDTAPARAIDSPEGVKGYEQAPLNPVKFADQSETPDALGHRGESVQEGLPFTGRAELPFNLVEDLDKAHRGLSVEGNPAKALTELRSQWDRVEKMMQQASDARLEKTNLGTVENGPYKTTLKMLEEKRAEIARAAETLEAKYGSYLSEVEKTTIASMKRILETNPRNIHNALDMGPRAEKTTWPWIEKTQTLTERNKFNNEGDKALSSHTSPTTKLGGVGRRGRNQGGAIDPEVFLKDFPEFVASKVKDAYGKLQVMYHGTSKDKAFKNINAGQRGAWFTRNPKEASSYAADNDSQKGVYEDGKFRHVNTASRVMPAYLNIQNPFDVQGSGHSPIVTRILGQLNRSKAYGKVQKELFHRLKYEGYDGVKWGDGVWVAFKPEQIQSALSPSTNPNRGKRGQGGAVNPSVFVEGAKKLLGKSDEQYNKFKEQLKSEGLDLSDDITRAMFKKQQGGPKYTAPNPQASILNVTRNLPGFEKLDNQYLNTWDMEQLTKAVVDWGKDIQFGTKNTIKKIVNGRFVAKIHPVLSYVSSNIHRIKNEVRLRSENLLMGDAYDSKGRRIPAKGSPMELWSRFSEADKAILNDVGQAFTNKADGVVTDIELNAKARELHGRDLTEAELQSYRARRKGLDKAWKDMNDYILANPKANGALREPLPYLPNFWSPAEFGGKFLVFIKDPATGKVEGMSGSYFLPNKAKLQAAFPGKDVSFIEKSISNNLNPEALEATIRYLAEPKREAVRTALNEAMRAQGFKKHSSKREGVAGWLGSEGGTKGVKNYEKVYEEYIRSVYNHIGNRELDKLHSSIGENTAIDRVAPRAVKLGLESVDQARGRMNSLFSSLEKEVGQALNGVGLPQSFLGDIRKVSNEASVKLLIAFGKVSQLTAQLFQAAQSAPIKVLGMAAENAGMNSIESIGTLMKVSAKTMHDLVNPSEQTIKDVIGLRREGALEATFQYDYKEYNQGMSALKNKPLEWLTLTAPLTMLESGIVRKPAGLMFVNFLREVGYPEANIYKMASELTDQYSATAKQYESAHVFGRTGEVGRFARPLQSFSTTWLGTYMEALQTAMRNPTSAAHALPLLYGLVATYAVTGIMGLPGIKEWDAVVEFVNKHANTSFKTGTETVLANVKSGEARFGYLWAKLGVNLGTTMQAPTMTQSVAPGVQLLGSAASALSTGVRNTGVFGEHNKPTESEKREAVKGITPASSWGMTESYFSNPSTMSTVDRFMENPTGTYKNNRSEGGFDRNDRDWNVRKYLGAYTTKEAADKARNWEATRVGKEEKSHKSDLVQLIVDQMISTGKIDQKLLDRAVELKYPPADLQKAIKAELMDQYLPKDDKLMGKGRSLKQQRAAQLLRELQ